MIKHFNIATVVLRWSEGGFIDVPGWGWIFLIFVGAVVARDAL